MNCHYCIRPTLIAFALLTCFALTSRAQTAETIIDKNINARGGLQRIEKVRSIKMSGYASMNGVNAPFTIIMERPEKLRIELMMRSDTIIQAYDGRSGWAKIPQANGSVIKSMTPSEAQSLKEQADFDGPLVHYKQKHNQVTLLGKATVDSVDSYKLVVQNTKGEKTTMFVNSKTFHIIREVTRKKVTGSNPVSSYMARIETDYRDFRAVRGLILPFSIETFVDGNKISRLKIDSIDLNTAFPDSLFSKPIP